ncbi:MAG: hypothetical protein ACLS8R_03340 [Anaeromassilibacillus sp.]
MAATHVNPTRWSDALKKKRSQPRGATALKDKRDELMRSSGSGAGEQGPAREVEAGMPPPMELCWRGRGCRPRCDVALMTPKQEVFWCSARM